MLNGPKNGLTYTQNDREKWRNTFPMPVSASLHVLVTEKVQQASTITLAPRCSHASDSPGPAMVEFLSNPFIPCNLRPKYLKTGGVYPPIRRAQCDRRGGPLGQAGEAPSQGVRPFAVAQGASPPPCNFGRLVGPCCPSRPKIIFEVGLAPIRGRWWVWVHPCAEKKKTEKTAKQSFQPSWTEFLQGPYLQTGMRIPVFFAFIAKSTSNSTQKCEKFFSHFLDPPPRKKFFFRLCQSSKSPKLRSFLFSSLK